jgi:hypothetical protein
MTPPEQPDEPAALDYAGPDTGKRVVLARFSSPYEAHLAASKLEAEGIPCGVGESRSAYFGSMASVLLVATDDLPRAVSILSATPARRALVVPSSVVATAPPRVLRLCPRCHSAHLGPAGRHWHIAAGLLALCWVPFTVPGSLVYVVVCAILWTVACMTFRPTRCRDCGQKIPED